MKPVLDIQGDTSLSIHLERLVVTDVVEAKMGLVPRVALWILKSILKLDGLGEGLKWAVMKRLRVPVKTNECVSIIDFTSSMNEIRLSVASLSESSVKVGD
jgi:hypothetical protein